MRTRRSWRNQERLWRALGGPKPAAPVVEDEVAAVEKMLATPGLGRRTRGQLERDLIQAKMHRARKPAP